MAPSTSMGLDERGVAGDLPKATSMPRSGFEIEYRVFQAGRSTRSRIAASASASNAQISARIYGQFGGAGIGTCMVMSTIGAPPVGTTWCGVLFGTISMSPFVT